MFLCQIIHRDGVDAPNTLSKIINTLLNGAFDKLKDYLTKRNESLCRDISSIKAL